MQKIYCTLLILFFSVISQAHPNPQFRVCAERGAQFVVINAFQDQVGLCNVQNSYVGAIDMMELFYEGHYLQSIQDYTLGITSCNGAESSVSTLEGGSFAICTYQDGSVIDMNSLLKGRYDFSQIEFNNALGF